MGHNKSSILKEGLKVRRLGAIREKARSIDDLIQIDDIRDLKISDVDFFIDKYKPEELPEWKSLNNCIYLTEVNDYKKYWQPRYGEPWGLFKLAFTTNVHKLDTERLFLSEGDTQILNRICEAILDINHKKRMGSNDTLLQEWMIQDQVALFWGKLIPYEEYIKNPSQYPKPSAWPGCYEYMYFENIDAKFLDEVTPYNY